MTHLEGCIDYDTFTQISQLSLKSALIIMVKDSTS